MQRRSNAALRLAAFFVFATVAPLWAQSDWPAPPDNWWVDLDDGGYPSATFEINMGMAMTITQAIESVEGTQITVSTAVSMMGNAIPPQTQVLDASTLTPEGGIAMMQGMGGPPNPNAPDPQAALAALDPVVERVEDTTCQVGSLEVECTEWEVAIEGMTSRVWHAPSIPPVFQGGIVRAEADIAGQSFVTTMTSYTGSLIE